MFCRVWETAGSYRFETLYTFALSLSNHQGLNVVHTYIMQFSVSTRFGAGANLTHEKNDQHKERTHWHWITCDELCLSSKVVHETSISSSIFKRERCFFQKQNREHDHANVLSDIFEKEQEEKEKCLHSRQSIVRVE